MQGPAVFYGLGALRKGSTIEIHRADGRTAAFTIYGAEVYPKFSFPSAKVYNDPPDAELRLITCGGGCTNGLVVRAADPADRRASAATLTDAGKEQSDARP